MTRAAIYARLSQDRNGESTSTARQLASCEAWVAARGWEVVDRFVDADLSAFKNVARPEYDRLVEALTSDELDVIVAWKLDRILRRPRDFERLWSACEEHNANIATVEDGIDTSTPFVGKLLPRLMAIFAEMESESISVRSRSKAVEIARAGGHHGGGTRPFGLSPDWSTVIESEAAVLREAAERLLAGESLRGVAMDFNRRGITTSTGGSWKPETLRQTLVSPRIAGLRRHHGEVVGRDGYPAILDEGVFRRLEGLLRHGSRRRGPQARKYLLTGIVRCHACGRPMVGHRQQGSRETYICQAQPRGCGKTKVGAQPLDERVRDLVLERLDSPEMADALRDHELHTPTVDLDQLHADEEALEELARDHYVDRLIGRAEYLAARGHLEARIESNRAKMSRSNGSGRLRTIAGLGDQLREAWDAEPLDWRRALVSNVVDRIVIGPAVRGRNRFDPARVAIEWKYE